MHGGLQLVAGGCPGKRIWQDSRLLEELSYCVPLGLPHSQFLAWPEDDRDKALAYNREMASVCKGCGTRQSEWAADADAYIGDFFTCDGCARMEGERDNVGEGAKGVHIRLLPAEIARARVERGEGIS